MNTYCIQKNIYIYIYMSYRCSGPIAICRPFQTLGGFYRERNVQFVDFNSPMRSGQTIITQGDVGREFFIIQSGEAEVLVSDGGSQHLGCFSNCLVEEDVYKCISFIFYI